MNEHGDLKKDLEWKKREIDEAIQLYPAPIPACDEQFNHLLNERERIMAEIRELQKKYPKP